jgi:hypothetical protein
VADVVKKDVSGVMASICEAWRMRIRASEVSDHRKGFMRTADMCYQFFAGAMGLMWSPEFREKFLGNMPAPRFKLTIAKAFEMVAIMGPSVMWDYAGRVSKGIKPPDLPRIAFGPMDDETAEQRYQLYLEDVELMKALQDTRSVLMDTYLNWAQREQPGGFLSESHKAITEAIVMGRGCTVTGTYKFPGSNRTLTKTEYFCVRDLYLDPECRNAGLHDCYWMARKRRTPYWELERMFKLPKDTLKYKANREALTTMSMTSSAANEHARLTGKTNDIVEWYEIWSKEGVGTRTGDVQSSVAAAFEEVIGDYAYLAICSGVDYPLNMPPHLLKVATDDDARAAMDWPIPYYKDGRWPVCLLDFYERPDSAWPMAPMAMGLGELVFLNVVISVLAERCAESCRTNGLVSSALGDDIIKALKDSSFSGWTEFPQEMAANVDKLIHYVQTPGINRDVYEIIDRISEMFDRRTGLTDLMYGLNPGGKVDRSATDSANKQQAVSVRPDWMQRCAEKWQTDIANNERIAAGWNVIGPHLMELLGQDGARLWDELIANEDPEVYVRQMRTTLEANSIKKPNKFRDNANLQQTIGYVMPLLKEYWNTTGDPGPLNAYIKSMADAMEQDAESWLLPELEPPQPSEEEMAAQQAEAQRRELEMAAAQENLKGKQLRNQKLESETMGPVEMVPEMSPEMMGVSAIPGEFPQEPLMPVAQDRSPEDMQEILSQLAQQGAM